MSAEEKLEYIGPETTFNYWGTFGAVGIPVGVNVAEKNGLIPPLPKEAYIFLTEGVIFAGLCIDTAIYVAKRELRNARLDRNLEKVRERRKRMENG